MRSKVVTIHEAKTNLSRLLQKAAQGQDVIIFRGAKPVARLVPIGEVKGRRRPGTLKGKLVVGPEFFDKLSADELSVWELG